MAKQAKIKGATRKTYSPEFRDESLALAEKLGVPAAAAQLELSTSLLYRWRSRSRAGQQEKAAACAQCSAVEVQAGESERLEHTLAERADELERLELKLAEQAEELGILKKAEAYFSKRQS